MRLPRLVATLLTLALAGCEAIPGHSPPGLVPVRKIDDARRAQNVAAFDAMWERVSTSYYRPARLSADGIDWSRTRATYRPQVEAATTDDAARSAMNAALATLKETHFAVVAGDPRLESHDDHPTGYVGVALREIDGDAVAFRVDPTSPADTAGVRAGWILLTIDDRSVPAGSSSDGPIDVIRRIEADARELAGDPGAPMTAEFLDAARRTRRVTLTPTSMPANRVAKFGNLPPMDLRIDARTLDGGVGYFGLSVFLDPPRVMPAWQAFIAKHFDAPGIILDLRGNPGGIGQMATGMAGFLVDRAGLKLGTMTTCDGALQFLINPRTPRYAGKVAVLVDGFSLSTSEILAQGLQDLDRAKVFGQQTPGAALPSTVTRLPNGDLFQYAVADYVSDRGTRLEGRGVTPDEVLPLTRADLLAGRDAPLDAALHWISP